MPRAFLDVEVDPEKCGKVPYERGVAFVKAQAEMYGLSSSVLTELPPDEVERLPELYASDFEWSEKGPVVWELAPSRIVVKLFEKESPAAVENFLGLCAGKGKSKNSGKDLHYKDTPIHRVVKGFMCQGGDIVKKTGAAGESIWGKPFKDDKAGLALNHDRPGLLSMANSGKNSNTSQFFLTFAPAKQLDGKHVVFGEVEEGAEVLKLIEATAGPNEAPQVPVIVTNCGVLD
jgi:cyclophilin family peptidyl-prolyl cis-trans isomerase